MLFSLGFLAGILLTFASCVLHGIIKEMRFSIFAFIVSFLLVIFLGYLAYKSGFPKRFFPQEEKPIIVPDVKYPLYEGKG